MKTFEQYMEFKSIEPLIWKAATLMVELEIEPDECLTLFMENEYWNQGLARASAGTARGIEGLGLGMQGLGGMGRGALGAIGNAGSEFAKGVANSPVGQGVKGWWEEFRSADRKIRKAAEAIGQAMSDPHVQALGENELGLMHKMVQHLSRLSELARQKRMGLNQEPTNDEQSPTDADEQPSSSNQPVSGNQPSSSNRPASGSVSGNMPSSYAQPVSASGSYATT